MASKSIGTRKDLYALFGVSSDAAVEEIRKAYRAIAKETHPDGQEGSPEAEAKFKEVSQAYAVLGNAERRIEYDNARAALARNNNQPKKWGARPVKRTANASFHSFQVAKPKNVVRRPEHSGYAIPHAVNPLSANHRPGFGARTTKTFKAPTFEPFHASKMGMTPRPAVNPVFKVRVGNIS